MKFIKFVQTVVVEFVRNLKDLVNLMGGRWPKAPNVNKGRTLNVKFSK